MRIQIQLRTIPKQTEIIITIILTALTINQRSSFFFVAICLLWILWRLYILQKRCLETVHVEIVYHRTSYYEEISTTKFCCVDCRMQHFFWTNVHVMSLFWFLFFAHYRVGLFRGIKFDSKTKLVFRRCHSQISCR